MAIQTTNTDIHLRSSQAMGLLSTSPYSISTWINATWNGGTRFSFVGLYGPAADTPLGPPITALQIGTAAGTGDIVCWTWGGGSIVSGTGMTAFNGIWVHIGYTFDGDTHRLYRNGIQIGTTTTDVIVGYLNQVYINGYPGSGTGEVASFQTDLYTLWRRTLSADEMLTIAASKGARHGIILSAIARYEMDELAAGSTVSNVIDLSGNGHNLTPVGAGTPITYTYIGAVANSNIRPVQ